MHTFLRVALSDYDTSAYFYFINSSNFSHCFGTGGHIVNLIFDNKFFVIYILIGIKKKERELNNKINNQFQIVLFLMKDRANKLASICPLL